jgi:integrase/recombinase XerD
MNNQEILTEYLDYYQHSKQSQNTRKSAINYFFKKYGYSKSIFDITTSELKKYFTWLKNLKEINLNTKKTKWNLLISFIGFLKEENESFLVTIPSKSINWNGTSNKTDKSNKHVYATRREIEKILQYFKDENFKNYLIFRLLVDTGMRKGELINAKIDELDIKNRCLNTNKGKSGEKFNFFKEDLQSYLSMYLKERKEYKSKYNNLFLSSHKKPYSERAFNQLLKPILKKLGINKNITCHTFRRSLNDFRKENDCPLEDREQLLGHKTNNVNISGYTKSDISRHRELYDKWYPYENLTL